MLPLAMASIGKSLDIERIGGAPEVRGHLENLGFIVGDTVSVVSSMGGNLIVQVKDSRVALGSEMAMKIMVSERMEKDEDS